MRARGSLWCSLCCLLLCALAGGGPAARAAVDLPATMVLTGRLAADAGSATTPRAGDAVLAFSAVDGQLAGSGPVGAGGNYLAVLGRMASFNGTPVVLELMQGNRRYRLLRDGAPAWLRFAGQLLPERTPLDLQVGEQSAELTAAEQAEPRAQRLAQRPDIPCAPELDANGDGVCDATDWAILREFDGGLLRAVARPGP
jgi:hypothetical protein